MAGEGDETSTEPERSKPWWVIILCVFGFLASLYVFLVGLELLEEAFKCLGGRGAGTMYAAISDPMVGLMTGILATVMVQSPATSMSIVVSLVGSDRISVKAGIPIVLGANIGTSVTSTIVSLGQCGDRVQLQRAFAGAAVHDLFNWLAVACMLPLEVIVAAIQGEGGPLYWITKAVTDAAMRGEGRADIFQSPIQVIANPLTTFLIRSNRYVIRALALGEPQSFEPIATNRGLCTPRRLSTKPDEGGAAGGLLDDSALRRRLPDVELKNCSHFYCVSEALDRTFEKISSLSYQTDLTKCDDYILSPEKPCGDAKKCYLDADRFYSEHVTRGRIIEAGLLRGAGDVGGGISALASALLLLVGGLLCLCKVLRLLVLGRARRTVAKAAALNGYVAMLVGALLTSLVQSSSLVASALTPFCGLGILPLEKMLPLTLGANIGTAATAFISSLSTFTHHAVQIALCDLFFNVIGILIWFPLPWMRQITLNAAKTLGLYARYYRFVPLLYILFAFVFVPNIALALSAVFHSKIVGGVVFLLFLLLAIKAFVVWWIQAGCYKVVSREEREEAERELREADVRVLGGAPPQGGGAPGSSV